MKGIYAHSKANIIYCQTELDSKNMHSYCSNKYCKYLEYASLLMPWELFLSITDKKIPGNTILNNIR
jgi:hypothetical protein